MAQQVNSRYAHATLIDRDGNFNIKVQEDLKMAAENGLIFAVSIIGVQSTGKSTLLNHLFSTGFRVMDDSQGMHQTTEGIWVAKCQSTTGGHGILAIDTEGSDGSEREEDVKFEKQTALFALAISNTVIINMKCDTINLNNGASRPLLRTVFEAMIRKFIIRHKVNLVFVLRDKNKCPLVKLEEQLKKGLNEIWKGMIKPQSQVNTALEDYFNIKAVAMSNYEEKQEQFEMEVASLREWIISYSTSSEGAAGRTPASAFAEYAKKIWDEIKEDKDLDLPGYRIMVAEIRCNRIAEEKYQSFCENSSWLKIKKDVESGAIQGFGEKVSSLIDNYLSQYDEEALHYDESKRKMSRNQLIDKILQVVEPTYLCVLEHKKRAILEYFEQAVVDELKEKGVLMAVQQHKFINEFLKQHEDAVIKQSNWNHTTEKLTQIELEIARHIEGVRAMNALLEQHQKDKQEFWLKVASIGGNVLGQALSVAILILLREIEGIEAVPETASAAVAMVAKFLQQNLIK